MQPVIGHLLRSEAASEKSINFNVNAKHKSRAFGVQNCGETPSSQDFNEVHQSGRKYRLIDQTRGKKIPKEILKQNIKSLFTVVELRT